jgi:hypothetical protein
MTLFAKFFLRLLKVPFLRKQLQNVLEFLKLQLVVSGIETPGGVSNNFPTSSYSLLLQGLDGFLLDDYSALELTKICLEVVGLPPSAINLGYLMRVRRRLHAAQSQYNFVGYYVIEDSQLKETFLGQVRKNPRDYFTPI